MTSNMPRGIPAILASDALNDAQPPLVPAIVQQWVTAWNTADAKGMAELFTPDGIYDDYAFQVRSQGRKCMKTWVMITCGNIPDAHAEVTDALQDGSRIAVRWIFRGTPVAFGSTPTTGKSFSVPVFSLFEMNGTRIQRVSDYYNLADVLRQIGLPAGPWVPLTP